MTIGGRYFKVAHDGSGNKALGGRNSEVQMNGDGSYRVVQTVMPGMFSDIQVEIDDGRNDLEYLQEWADEALPRACTVTTASNVTYTGDLVIVGEITKDETNGLATLGFQGSKLTKI